MYTLRDVIVLDFKYEANISEMKFSSLCELKKNVCSTFFVAMFLYKQNNDTNMNHISEHLNFTLHTKHMRIV